MDSDKFQSLVWEGKAFNVPANLLDMRRSTLFDVRAAFMEGPVVCLVYAKWCGHSMNMFPIFKDFVDHATSPANPMATILLLEETQARMIPELGQLSQIWGVRGFPTAMIHLPGDKAWRAWNFPRDKYATGAKIAHQLAVDIMGGPYREDYAEEDHEEEEEEDAEEGYAHVDDHEEDEEDDDDAELESFSQQPRLGEPMGNYGREWNERREGYYATVEGFYAPTTKPSAAAAPTTKPSAATAAATKPPTAAPTKALSCSAQTVNTNELSLVMKANKPQYDAYLAAQTKYNSSLMVQKTICAAEAAAQKAAVQRAAAQKAAADAAAAQKVKQAAAQKAAPSKAQVAKILPQMPSAPKTTPTGAARITPALTAPPRATLAPPRGGEYYYYDDSTKPGRQVNQSVLREWQDQNQRECWMD